MIKFFATWFLTFYDRLYADEGNCCMSSMVHGFPSITDEIMNLIKRIVGLENVKEALFYMSPQKAPGIDGFPASFFQKSWDILKLDLFKFVTTAFEDGKLPRK